MNSSRCYTNRDCAYFPCHPLADGGGFNCLFCFCPLYYMGDGCGGAFSYDDAGTKDCAACGVPHEPEKYDMIIARLRTTG